MIEPRWWQVRVVYQIYPMSFADSNGDGIGDILGIVGKLDYLKELGVGILWLSPIYVSPNEDNGYDIADYCGVQPQYGSLDDVDLLLKEAHTRDIKIILDLVINHTSTEHVWFRQSRKKIEPYSDYYYWRKEPNNWTGFFGEKAWEYDEERKEYYLHLFAKGQSDLNYHNPNVIREVENVMRFWLDRGVDGFRCDVINILWKENLENGKRRIALTGSEKYISALPLHDLLRRFYDDVFSHYDCYTVGETVFVNPRMAKDLTDPARKELNTVFSFEHMETDCFFVKWLLRRFSPERFFKTISKWQRQLDWNTVYFENHDQPRSVSRFCKAGYHDQASKTLCTLLLSLRGTAFIYEGQEIGMTNFDYQDMSEIKDVESWNIWNLTGKMKLPKSLRWKMIRTKGRDNARTPMQWSSEPNGGFSTGKPWLKPNSNFTTINVEKQLLEPDSVLNYYKRMIKLRNGNPALLAGDFEEVYQKGGVFAFSRSLGNERVYAVFNISGKKRKSPISGECLISTEGRTVLSGEMKPYEAALIRG